MAAAGAIAVAAGPLIGGAVTTWWTWRLVFAGEVVIVVAILAAARKITDVPPEERKPLDVVGILLSAAGLWHGGVRRPAVRRVGLGAAEAGGPGRGGPVP